MTRNQLLNLLDTFAPALEIDGGAISLEAMTPERLTLRLRTGCSG